jgi:hypothetical protein
MGALNFKQNGREKFVQHKLFASILLETFFTRPIGDSNSASPVLLAYQSAA